MAHSSLIIDNLQYANWSEKIFRQMQEGGVSAVHVTIAYHEQFRETVLNIEAWNRWFRSNKRQEMLDELRPFLLKDENNFPGLSLFLGEEGSFEDL